MNLYENLVLLKYCHRTVVLAEIFPLCSVSEWQEICNTETGNGHEKSKLLEKTIRIHAI